MSMRDNRHCNDDAIGFEPQCRRGISFIDWRNDGSWQNNFLVIFTSRPQTTLLTPGRSGHTDVPPVQDQPVVCFMNKLGGNKLY
jgi:hypothetical protein